MAKTKMRPMRIARAQERDVRSQFGALCYCIRDGKVRILMVTSRGTGRWILPKGWPVAGASPPEAALMEAWEEAGVQGHVTGDCLGIYTYLKAQNRPDELPCVVAMFPIEVERLKRKYPEAAQRKRKWFSQGKAASLIDEPELAQMVRHFAPAAPAA